MFEKRLLIDLLNNLATKSRNLSAQSNSLGLLESWNFGQFNQRFNQIINQLNSAANPNPVETTDETSPTVNLNLFIDLLQLFANYAAKFQNYSNAPFKQTYQQMFQAYKVFLAETGILNDFNDPQLNQLIAEIKKIAETNVETNAEEKQQNISKTLFNERHYPCLNRIFQSVVPCREFVKQLYDQTDKALGNECSQKDRLDAQIKTEEQAATAIAAEYKQAENASQNKTRLINLREVNVWGPVDGPEAWYGGETIIGTRTVGDEVADEVGRAAAAARLPQLQAQAQQARSALAERTRQLQPTIANCQVKISAFEEEKKRLSRAYQPLTNILEQINSLINIANFRDRILATQEVSLKLCELVKDFALKFQILKLQESPQTLEFFQNIILAVIADPAQMITLINVFRQHSIPLAEFLMTRILAEARLPNREYYRLLTQCELDPTHKEQHYRGFLKIGVAPISAADITKLDKLFAKSLFNELTREEVLRLADKGLASIELFWQELAPKRQVVAAQQAAAAAASLEEKEAEPGMPEASAPLEEIETGSAEMPAPSAPERGQIEGSVRQGVVTAIPQTSVPIAERESRVSDPASVVAAPPLSTALAAAATCACLI